MISKVLIVDDSPIIHKLLRKSLENMGFNICGDANNGKEGVELSRSLSPDLIFLDITMPIMDGLEAAIKIKTINPKQKIIMLSAMGDEEIINEAKSAGVDIFLKKPFDAEKIKEAIDKLS